MFSDPSTYHSLEPLNWDSKVVIPSSSTLSKPCTKHIDLSCSMDNKNHTEKSYFGNSNLFSVTNNKTTRCDGGHAKQTATVYPLPVLQGTIFVQSFDPPISTCCIQDPMFIDTYIFWVFHKPFS